MFTIISIAMASFQLLDAQFELRNMLVSVFLELG
jgi:hypothetical protein